MDEQRLPAPYRRPAAPPTLTDETRTLTTSARAPYTPKHRRRAQTPKLTLTLFNEKDEIYPAPAHGSHYSSGSSTGAAASH